MSAAPDALEKKSILFKNGQSARVLHIREVRKPAEILKDLDITESQAAIIVAGSTQSFSTPLKNRLTDLLSRGVAQAALDCAAILIDEGLKTGVSEILGQGVADRGRKTKLVGVPPRKDITNPDEPVGMDSQELDPNHTHFIINGQDQPNWQAKTMCDLATAASQNKRWILTVLVGGESEGTAMDLVLETVRREWPLVVIEGSGPLANEIAKRKKAALNMEKQSSKFWRWINPFWIYRRLRPLQDTNPRLYEIISDGKIMLVGKKFEAIQLRNLIKGIFQPSREKIVWTAWQRFADYDQNSIRHRNAWHRLRKTPLYLGVLSTLLVLIHSTTDLNPQGLIEGDQNLLWANWYTGRMGALGGFINTRSLLDLILRFIIILLPIVVSGFLAVETRLKLGSKYLVLRGAAETVKRGIYSYRTLKGRVTDPKAVGSLPYSEKGLATHLGNVSKMLTDSDVNEAAFIPYGGPIPPNMFGAEEYDDGFTELDPETYVRVRIGDQLKFYTLKTNRYERDMRNLQYLMLIFGGLGSFLAAIGAQYWLPLTAAIVSAATAYLEYQQLEQLLTKYNLTKSSLESIQAEWQALSPAERQEPERVQSLVRNVEAILESENQGWVQYIKQSQESGTGDTETVPA
jgi:hypothetical protein